MPSTYTASLRFEMQGTGENLNNWGTRLNVALSRIDKAIAGRSLIELAGVNYPLTVSTVADDEARSAILDLIGVGNCNVLIPSVPKVYVIRNGTNGKVQITTGAGAAATVNVGETITVICDGADVARVAPVALGNQRLQEVGAPLQATDAATKGYVATLVSNTVFDLLAGELPMQAGNEGKALITDGERAGWDWPTDPAARADLERQKARRRLMHKDLT